MKNSALWVVALKAYLLSLKESIDVEMEQWLQYIVLLAVQKAFSQSLKFMLCTYRNDNTDSFFYSRIASLLI